MVFTAANKLTKFQIHYMIDHIHKLSRDYLSKIPENNCLHVSGQSITCIAGIKEVKKIVTYHVAMATAGSELYRSLKSTWYVWPVGVWEIFAQCIVSDFIECNFPM